MHWYALHVASCSEPIVRRRLTDSGIESYYPATMRQSKRQYRPSIEQRLFPGYVFARFELCDRRPVVSIKQVIQILGTANTPVPIPDHEIAAVRTMTNAATMNIATCMYVAAGETVVIRRGPLQGLQGIVTRIKGKTRVVVSITMLRQSISAEVDADDCAIAG